MANHKSAMKRIRSNQRRAVVGKARKTRIRTRIKMVETAIAGGNYAEAQAALRLAEPEVMSGVARGVMHKNTASRRMSRLSRRVRALQI